MGKEAVYIDFPPCKKLESLAGRRHPQTLWGLPPIPNQLEPSLLCSHLLVDTKYLEELLES